MDNPNIYCDPYAFIQREKMPVKQKIDLQHIERVIYPQPYQNAPTHYDKSMFRNDNVCPPPQKSAFDFSKILSMLGGNNNLSSLLPGLLNGLGVNKDVMPFLKNFAPVKKADAKVVESFEKDTISKYEKV